jgi:WXG100 family type VII secretion target
MTQLTVNPVLIGNAVSDTANVTKQINEVLVQIEQDVNTLISDATGATLTAFQPLAKKVQAALQDANGNLNSLNQAVDKAADTLLSTDKYNATQLSL